MISPDGNQRILITTSCTGATFFRKLIDVLLHSHEYIVRAVWTFTAITTFELGKAEHGQYTYYLLSPFIDYI